MLKYSKSRGDTLVEVLFAVTIFSLVAVGGISIMNQGTATSQRALEITLVRNEIDAQAETLRFLNASYVAAYQKGAGSASYTGPAREWRFIKDNTASVASASNFNSGSTCASMSPPNSSFILNTRNATYTSPSGRLVPANIFSQVKYDTSNNLTAAEGIWIEAVSSVINNGNNQANAGYVDFHIRACWDSPGQSVPVTIGTIVRLYEPR